MSYGTATLHSASAAGPTPPAGSILRHVVVADDDPDALDLLCDVLAGPKVAVHRASNGIELAQLLSTEQPDLVVTDVNMPGADGFSVVRSARAANLLAPVVFVSGIFRADLDASVQAVGNAVLIRKPIAVSALRAYANTFLGVSA